ncbi:hypothetical protein [Fulvivirga sp.]|uniref:hypothetical protein n=1 Tax=Fulvivirga sp. TaxID=1931237 RepID=UPI0032ED753B
MKKTAIFLTFLLVIVFLSYLFYDKYLKMDEVAIQEYVTDDAALIIESNSFLASLDKHKKNNQEILELLNSPEYKRILSVLDTSKVKWDEVLKGSVLISLHVSGNNSFDNTYYIDLTKNNRDKVFLTITDQFRANSSLSTRVYLGREIHELGKAKEKITYYLDNNILVFSLKPYLVEDVVRAMEEEGNSFFEKHSDLINLPNLSNDDGNLYINSDKLNDLVGVFGTDKSEFIKNLAANAFLDVTFSDKSIFLNGFTLSSKGEFLSTFENQIPVPDNFDYFIPSEASIVSKFLTSDPIEWHSNLVDFWKADYEKFVLKRTDFVKSYGLEVDKIYSWIKDGVCLASFDNDPLAKKILYISTIDINEALNQLNEFSERESIALGDSVYAEEYGDYEIREIKVKEFPMMIFGPQFEGFGTTYYMALDDKIAISNTITSLKDLLYDIENENTLGRSVGYNEFKESGLEESNVSYYFNLPRILSTIQSGLKENWVEYVEKNRHKLKALKRSSIQFSRVDQNYYTSMALQWEDNTIEIENSLFKTTQQLAFINPIITKPFVVRNHNNNLLEVLQQDSLSNLNLISSEGKKLWSIPISERIVSEIYQIDYYKNKKLQYLFATSNKIYMIDRLGNTVEQYPKAFDFGIQDLTLVDYDNSKNYRFMLNDDRGNIYLTNKEGKLLEGWNPLAGEGKLSQKPFHIRVRGRDYMIALFQNGDLSIYTRRGELNKEFPVKLDGRFESQVFVEMGTDDSNTKIHTVSREGRLFIVNLKGQILSTEELYKLTKEARFQIVPDALGKNYILARQEKNRLVILNSNRTELLSKDYLDSNELSIQYYHFNIDNQIFAVTDKVQGFTYLYRNDGSLLGSSPIDSDKEVGILYSEANNTYTIYTISGDTFRQLVF